MVGRTLSHYRILAQLGAGGMGVVYRAEDIRLGREVAVKFVSEDAAHDDQAVQRLRSEARAASALNHANICTIYDVGEDEGHPFIVMELMKGQTLRDRLVSGPLKVHQLVDIGIEISDALHAAHSDGIIHRDIKPGNIFLTDRGHVKILDFGLAKLTRPPTGAATTNDLPRTVVGVTIGTVSYMSPEQAAGEDLDGRTDLFSLGVVLYECATGRHPFPGKTSAVILSAILNRSPIAPVTINPALPLRLQEVINNCLEKDRELRYQSAADLRADLKRVRRDIESSHSRVDVVSRRSGAAVDPADEPHHAATREPSSHVTTSRSSRARMVMVAVAAAALLAAAAYALWPRASMPTGDDDQVAALSSAAIENRVSLARVNFAARNYRAALSYAREVLAAQADHPEATRIRNDAQAMLLRFDEAIAQARAHLASGDVQETVRSLEAARELDPSSPIVVEIQSGLSDLVRERESAARESAQRQAARVPPPAREPAPPPRESPPPDTPRSVPSEPARVESPPAPIPAPVSPSIPEPAPPNAPPPAKTAPPEPAPAPPQTPPPSPPPEKRQSEPSRAELDDAAIRRVIASYGRAIETKDVGLFRAIKPNLSGDEERRLMDAFRATTSQQVNLTIVSVDQKGDAATVVLQRRDVLDVRGRRQTVESRQTLSLSRAGQGWVITEIR